MFGYDAHTDVLSNVSASVNSGEMLGIVGPNGSGKSTLLRILCGLLRPRSGHVALDGKPLAAFSGMERARTLAFLPQSVNPAFALTVFEVVCLGRYPHIGAFGAPRAHDLEIARRCMQDTEIESLHAREFMDLSGGERQRVLLASILAQEPDILLLDEPTSALDIHHQIEIFALLKRLSSEGYGIAVVTHDLNLAARFCDRLLLLSAKHGTLAEGAPDAVLTEAMLTEAYSSSVRVTPHPFTGTPFIWAETPKGRP